MDTPEKPEKPGLSECCGGGSCCPCVWDVYFEQLEKWQVYQKHLAAGECKEDTNPLLDKKVRE